MEENNDSVYNLLTSLCEKFFSSRDKIKTVRSSCYEVLLGKKLLDDPRKYKDLEGTAEPMLNLLAWCYKLTHEHNLKDAAGELEKCTERLKQSYDTDTNSFNSVLTFMLCLKDIPKRNQNKLDLSTLPEINNQMSNFNTMFKLPPITLGESHSMELFQINFEKQHSELFKSQQKSQTSFRIPTFGISEFLKDEGYSSPEKENIWDIVSKVKFSKRRSWESYGCGPPDKEKPFLSELGEISSLWVENLESLYLANNLFPSFTIMTNKMKARTTFIQDLKYLLVGMPSETFNVSNQEEFFISPGIMVEGITPDAIERHCYDFLFSGTCYRALNQMATPNPNTRKYKYSGYVFTEFCESLSRYLQFYRTAIISVPDSTNFLTFHEKTYQIQTQIQTLASICKVGPYASQTEGMPHGVALLNYLYQKVLGLTDKNLRMVLYSILYPCCQIYISRFLHQWVLKGSLNDPYEEFFVTPNFKYLSTRGRTYWTRSYRIKADIIPDFLMDLKDEILFCGRLMNLLHLSSPTNKLCMYLMGKNPLILSCCLTYDQLTQIEQNSAKYYLEASTECGSKFSFSQVLERTREKDFSYQNLIAMKRAVTLRRIELERQRTIQEQHDKKLEDLLMLKEQYDAAIEQKQLKIYKQIEKEIETMQENLRIEQMREKLIEEEAAKMINYYSELCRVAESRKEKIDDYIKSTKNIHIDSVVSEKERYKTTEISDQDKQNSSTDSFYSVPDEKSEKTEVIDENCDASEEETELSNENAESLDVLNANVEKRKQECPISIENTNLPRESSNTNTQQTTDIQQTVASPSTNTQQILDNFELARRNKAKILGITFGDKELKTIKEIHEPPKFSNLTEAQRNKLKVLSSEFGIDVIRENIRTDRILTIAQINRNKILGHDECFMPNYGDKKLDNENFVNMNLKNIKASNAEKAESKSSVAIRKSKSLVLDFDKIKPDHDKSAQEKPIPMSVDSTPMSDLPQIATPSSDFPRSTTPSSMFMSVDTKLDSFPNTADTHQTDDVFSFESLSKSTGTPLYQKSQESRHVPTFSKRVTVEEAKGISKNCLKLFLHESVAIPLLTQLKLANNEILKLFIEELNYLKHLESLRDYFFLQDGEFGRNITENLFDKLYTANFPLELINCRTLQHLVFSALDNSNKFHENSKYLSFKINSLPKCFDLGDPDVLDCLSLTYKLKWPLNILLPSDTVSKYDQVFKFLVKLNRVSWVLKKVFLELKVLAKETGKKEIYLMASPQYRRLHQYRHVMSHFMQTLQNYIVGEVLQPSWELFERNLVNVTNIDELYSAHTNYIKSILFRCLLNQRSVSLKNIIQKIFVVILKFYDYLRSREWTCDNGSYIHPNFSKLERIFKNFEEFVVYLFKVAKKVAKSGYQPYLIQFLDVLNVNDYYSMKLLRTAA